MPGQAHHFRRYAPEPIPYAIDRYTRQARRIYEVLNRRLGAGAWLAGDYSPADMAVFPWIRPHKWRDQILDEVLSRRPDTMSSPSAPAVQRGLTVLRDRLGRNRTKRAGCAWEILFAEQPTAKPWER